jgi:cytochrome P450
MTEQRRPITDWATDWDFNDPEWIDDPYTIWRELREGCPLAHTTRLNDGTWLPLTFEDLSTIAADTATFSNIHDGVTAGGTSYRTKMPPINSDPPEHQALRRAILPFFAPRRIEAWEPTIREHCDELAAAVAARGRGDAAVDYAQHIPVAAIAAILGIDPAAGPRFRQWVVDFVEVGGRDPAARDRASAAIMSYMAGVMAERRRRPGDDLISHLVTTEIDGRPLDDDVIRRMLLLQLVAGIDTTWSSIGAALWHLATNDADRARLVAEPDLVPVATEEFLRAYAPVNVVRRVTADTSVNGVEMRAGESVLMTFPIACRDPELFDRPDEVIIDRRRNRHPAFGLGIHRCLGSNLARLEMNVAIETWLRHVPEFSVAPGAEVRWTGGQIRGPRSIPIVVGVVPGARAPVIDAASPAQPDG